MLERLNDKLKIDYMFSLNANISNLQVGYDFIQKTRPN
jgi:hypothetical protein